MRSHLSHLEAEQAQLLQPFLMKDAPVPQWSLLPWGLGESGQLCPTGLVTGLIPQLAGKAGTIIVKVL